MTRVVEINVGIMCGSMPACAGFFRHHSPPTLIISLCSFVSKTGVGVSKILKIAAYPRRSSAKIVCEQSSENIPLTLGSMKGKGKYPTSNQGPQRDWMHHDDASGEFGDLSAQGLPTHREAWVALPTVSMV